MLSQLTTTADFINGEYVFAKLEKWRSERSAILHPSGLTELEMAQLRGNGPYIWVTWLTKLLVGENSCEWAAWFRTQHESWSWERVPSTFDQVAWQLAHTARINEVRERFEKQGYVVLTENQNSFILRSRTSGIAIALPLVESRTSLHGKALSA